MSVDAIILAAGQGTRMRPFSQLISKPLLPLINKPLLIILAERLIEVGIKRLVIVVNLTNQNEIQNIFMKNKFPIPIDFAIQESQKGTAHAISTGSKYTSSEHIISIAGDSLFPIDFFHKIIQQHINNQPRIKATLALQKVSREEITNLSSVLINSSGEITALVEKPKPDEILSLFASLSCYVLHHSVLNLFELVVPSIRNELEAPDIFNKLFKDRIGVMGCVTKDYVHISDPKDLWYHNMQLIGKKSNIIPSTTSIGSDVVLIKCIIGLNVKINSKCKLEQCLILDNTNIPVGTIANKAVIGSSNEKKLDIILID